MSLTEFGSQVKGLVILCNFVLLDLVVENNSKISFGSNNYGDVVIVVFGYLFVVLFKLKDGIGIGEVVDVEYSIEVFESAFLDVLKHFEPAGIPLYKCRGTIVRLTTNWRLIFIFLNLSWNATVGSISSLNFYFYISNICTSIPLMMDDLPASEIPTKAILMFYSFTLERERSRSVYIEYEDPLNIYSVFECLNK